MVKESSPDDRGQIEEIRQKLMDTLLQERKLDKVSVGAFLTYKKDQLSVAEEEAKHVVFPPNFIPGPMDVIPGSQLKQRALDLSREVIALEEIYSKLT